MYKKWMVLKKWVDLCETSVDLLPGTNGGQIAVFSNGPGNGFCLQCSNEPTAMTFLRRVFAEDHASDASWSYQKAG